MPSFLLELILSITFYLFFNVVTRVLLSGQVKVLVSWGLGLETWRFADQEMEKQDGKEEEYFVMGLYCHWVRLEEISKAPAIAFTAHSALESVSHLGNKDIERENVTKLSYPWKTSKPSRKHRSVTWQPLLRYMWCHWKGPQVFNSLWKTISEFLFVFSWILNMFFFQGFLN